VGDSSFSVGRKISTKRSEETGNFRPGGVLRAGSLRYRSTKPKSPPDAWDERERDSVVQGPRSEKRIYKLSLI